jgi:hypothetical protein
LTYEGTQIFISELDPILSMLILNFLLGIWLLSRVKRAQQQIAWLKGRLTDVNFVSERPTHPFVSKHFPGEPEQVHIQDKDSLISRVANEAPPTNVDFGTKDFKAALQDGSSIEDTAKLFGLTDDEAKVAAFSYRNN